MTSYPARLLCAGKEPELLQSRCAVLRQAGYEAQAATVPEVEVLLRTEEFDIIVVSAQLSESDRGLILSAAGETPTYVLHGLTLASELLAQVERLLPATRPRLPWSGPPCH
jgi:DNA-binding response OmpR family regulator